MSAEEGQIGITPIQVFTLSYLYSEELKMDEKERLLDERRLVTHHSQSSFSRNPISVSIREIGTKISSEAVSHMPRVNDILQELSVLEKNEYLELESLGGYRGEYTKFSITTDGIILVKQIFAQLSKVIENKEAYEKTIDKSSAGKVAKEWLKGIWNSLRDKAQDEIAEEILKGTKQYGPQIIGMVIRLLNSNN